MFLNLKSSFKFQVSGFKKRGFTLIEVIVAIFVITVGVLAAYNVIQQIMIYNRQADDRLTAAYLAKEGIEIVRNIRDENWLEGSSNWYNGLTGCSGGCEIDYNDESFYTGPERKLRLPSAGGFYNYLSGAETKFKREIIIDDSMKDDFITVSVEVAWDGYNVTAREILYNWYPGP